jgi:hypothetical protein
VEEYRAELCPSEAKTIRRLGLEVGQELLDEWLEERESAHFASLQSPVAPGGAGTASQLLMRGVPLSAAAAPPAAAAGAASAGGLDTIL